MFRKKTPYIKFRYRKDFEYLEKPKPSSKLLPDWYKKLARQSPGVHKNNTGTAKRCVPVFDACTNGYIIPAWVDFNIKVVINEEVGIEVNTPTDMGFESSTITNHSWAQVGDDCPAQKYPLGKALLKFTNPWVIETSPGWSCLIKSPPNHFSNIRLFEGVVDTDTYKPQIQLPFFWDGVEEGDFEIKVGDPLIHVVPFKRRDKLKIQYDEWDRNEMDKAQRKLESKFIDKYKTFFWHKRKQ